jgi:hypothetical protein
MEENRPKLKITENKVSRKIPSSTKEEIMSMLYTARKFVIYTEHLVLLLK